MKMGPIAKGSRLSLKTDGFIPFGLIPTHGESVLSIVKKLWASLEPKDEP